MIRIDWLTFLKARKFSAHSNKKSSRSFLKTFVARSRFKDRKISLITGIGTLELSWTNLQRKPIQFMVSLSSFFFLEPPRFMKPIQSEDFGMLPTLIRIFLMRPTNFMLIFASGISLQAPKMLSRISNSTLLINSVRHSHTAELFSLECTKLFIRISDRVWLVRLGLKNAKNLGQRLTISSWYCVPNNISKILLSYSVVRRNWFLFSSFLSFRSSLSFITAANFFSKTGHFKNPSNSFSLISSNILSRSLALPYSECNKK